MTHHLTPEERLTVHRAHAQKDGGYSSRALEFTILEDLMDSDSAIAEIHFEYCRECGLISPVGCDHGHMIWTHRPGCQRYGTDDREPLPEGLVKTYAEAFPNHPESTDDYCEGCLLICTVCGADGT